MSTRKYPPPWTELVPCPTCGGQRPISGRHKNFFDRAARRSCMTCRAKLYRTPRPQFVDGPCRPYAKRYQVDETIVDWVIVDRLMSGQQVPSTRAERVAAVAALTALGMPASTIAERMHVSQRTVVRLRVTIRQEAAA